MSNWIIEALNGAIYGKLAHTEMLNALRGITAKEAENSLHPNMHSIKDHVFHMIFWHDITLKAIQGKEIDWNTIKDTDWPAKDSNFTEKKWKKLVTTFTASLNDLKEIIGTKDLTKIIAGFGNKPLGKGIIVEIQHNSYHIGQIVLIRQLQGSWPPAEKSK
ncbi:MAG: DinB family protein [Candidatus Thorarchaeota archaeon]